MWVLFVWVCWDTVLWITCVYDSRCSRWASDHDGDLAGDQARWHDRLFELHRHTTEQQQGLFMSLVLMLRNCYRVHTNPKKSWDLKTVNFPRQESHGIRTRSWKVVENQPNSCHIWPVYNHRKLFTICRHDCFVRFMTAAQALTGGMLKISSLSQLSLQYCLFIW